LGRKIISDTTSNSDMTMKRGTSNLTSTIVVPNSLKALQDYLKNSSMFLIRKKLKCSD
jgi:hypothetical protein